MLDYDLAKIYGYSTKDFNNQIKHNIERFDEDLRWKFSTAKSINKIRYLPYAFTEHGISILENKAFNWKLIEELLNF